MDAETRAPGIDERVRRAVVLGFTWVISIAGVVWGATYVLVGAPGVARYPLGFAALSMLNGLLYRRLRSFTTFAAMQIALILVIPFLLDMDLGGMTRSGAVILWSTLAPVGTAMLFGPRPAITVFAAFLALGLFAIAHLSAAARACARARARGQLIDSSTRDGRIAVPLVEPAADVTGQSALKRRGDHGR